MNIYRQMQTELVALMSCKARKPIEQKKEAPRITAWIFREGRRPELTTVENSPAGFARALKTENIEDITLTCGLAVICDADNWWSDGDYTFAVGDVMIRGTVLVVGADEDGFKTIPREALDYRVLQEMCCVECCTA
ncbi:MAG: hypothetical protein IJ017_04425 [Oscillospiraceae bacterium]|nr:hypothetical protein [Oscillospiraceae bacterium]